MVLLSSFELSSGVRLTQSYMHGGYVVSVCLPHAIEKLCISDSDEDACCTMLLE